MKIEQDDLSRDEVAEFLRAHLAEMHEKTPAGSVHALALEALRQPEVTFWSAWDGTEVIGCAALKEIDRLHGEIKSMRTAPRRRGQGIASRLLAVLLDEARRRGYARVSLETGATAEFAAARSLYARSGFVSTGPFAEYEDDPHSAFMTLALSD